MMTHPPIRALETHYAGCRFRSRLEARWAVFFDHLGIEWEHEPEGYATAAGPYLPDFKVTLPACGCAGQSHRETVSSLFEVKPDGAGGDPRHVALAKEHRLTVARGLPRDQTSQGQYLTDMQQFRWAEQPVARPAFFIRIHRRDFPSSCWPCPCPHRLFLADWAGETRGQREPIDAAYAAARSARFDRQVAR